MKLAVLRHQTMVVFLGLATALTACTNSSGGGGGAAAPATTPTTITRDYRSEAMKASPPTPAEQAAIKAEIAKMTQLPEPYLMFAANQDETTRQDELKRLTPEGRALLSQIRRGCTISDPPDDRKPLEAKVGSGRTGKRVRSILGDGCPVRLNETIENSSSVLEVTANQVTSSKQSSSGESVLRILDAAASAQSGVLAVKSAYSYTETSSNAEYGEKGLTKGTAHSILKYTLIYELSNLKQGSLVTESERTDSVGHAESQSLSKLTMSDITPIVIYRRVMRAKDQSTVEIVVNGQTMTAEQVFETYGFRMDGD